MINDTERRYYIDWIRVLAFFLLIFFHCAMPFVVFGWEINNEERSIGLSRFIWWLHQWRLPLLFFISGVGISFSLRRRSILSFAGERFVRLFIPLVFAMLFTVPLQVYYEWLQTGRYHGSYISFYPSVWNFIPYPEGALTWSHMWFVVYLFVFCILLLPVFAIFKIKVADTLKQKLSLFFSNPFLLALLSVPLMGCYFTLYLKYPEQQNLLSDWFLFTFSIILIFYGYFLGSNSKFWNTCEKYRKHYLAIAVLCIAALYYRYWWKLDFPDKQNSRLYIYGILNSTHIWLLILSLLGFAKKHLNYSCKFLRYTNKAVYPFYILHQTIIVVFGYYVVQWHLPIFIKLLLLIIICFVSIFLLYHWIIKRSVITRILYGLKPKEKKNNKKVVLNIQQQKISA